GLLLGFVGVLQRASGAQEILWTIPLTDGGGPFSSFVNHNQAGGYLNMCLACSLILLPWAFADGRFLNAPRSASRSAPRSAARVPETIPTGWRAELLQLLARLDGRKIAAIV